jgi:hypothetical protein
MMVRVPFCIVIMVLLLAAFSGCDHPVPKRSKFIDIDTAPISQAELLPDSIRNMPAFDTTTMYGRAKKLVQQLRDTGDYRGVYGLDTLMDMNGDRQLDILLEYYGSVGTGEKNRGDVILFDKSQDRFLTENPIYLDNPTFDFKNKTIVSYYIANGGGHAFKGKWNGLRLDTLEYIEIDKTNYKNGSLKVESVRHNYITGKITRSVRDHVSLPEEYNVGDYKPVIKRPVE